jgi:predicted transcriptional regulator
MSVSRQQLRELVDLVEEKEIDTLFNVMMRFIPEDEATPDEKAAIEAGRAEFARGEFVRLEDVD